MELSKKECISGPMSKVAFSFGKTLLKFSMENMFLFWNVFLHADHYYIITLVLSYRSVT